MKVSLVIFSVLLFFNSCKKEAIPGAICGVKNPVEELPWLKNLTQDILSHEYYMEVSIYKTEWKGKTILIIDRIASSCFMCNAYYCNGSKLDVEGMSEYERNEFYKIILKPDDLIWKENNL